MTRKLPWKYTYILHVKTETDSNENKKKRFIEGLLKKLNTNQHVLVHQEQGKPSLLHTNTHWEQFPDVIKSEIEFQSQ